MKDILIFLGSGASVPFGLPSMKEMVDRFEKKLEKSNRITNRETMIQLYRSIKKTIFKTNGYVDLESVFTVLLSISKKMKYAHLGLTSLFAISKYNVDFNLNIATEEEVKTAKKLLKFYKTFVRQTCRVKESGKKIIDVYSDLFEKLGPRYVSQKVKVNYTYLNGCSIYTTNYDDGT